MSILKTVVLQMVEMVLMGTLVHLGRRGAVVALGCRETQVSQVNEACLDTLARLVMMASRELMERMEQMGCMATEETW